MTLAAIINDIKRDIAALSPRALNALARDCEMVRGVAIAEGWRFRLAEAIEWMVTEELEMREKMKP